MYGCFAHVPSSFDAKDFCVHKRADAIMKDQMKNTQTPASRGSNPNPPDNAEIVFARVLQLLQTNGSASSNIPGQDWLKKKHTIADVQGEIKKAQEKYHLRSKDSRTRKWLARFSSGVLYYGQIMDVLVQHHPEYVSLAWGTTKLLFVVSSQHHSSLSGLADRDRTGRRWQQRVLPTLSPESDQKRCPKHQICPLGGQTDRDRVEQRWQQPAANSPYLERETKHS
jgi:hypothetical protein